MMAVSRSPRGGGIGVLTRCLRLVLGCALAAATSGALTVAQGREPVHASVKAHEQGQGLLVSRLDSCYAITAKHVLGSRTEASLVGGRDGRQFGHGQLLQAFGEDDIAILRVTGALAGSCGAEVADVGRLEEVVATRAVGVLSYVYDDGSVGRLPLVVTDVGPRFLRVTPTSAREQLAQGMSGSLVRIADRPSGVLLEVEKGGEGKVLRYDRVIALLKAFFARAPAAAAAAPPPSSEVRQAGSRPGNLLAAAAGARVLRWSALPTAPESGPVNLIGSVRGPWLSSRKSFPVEVDFELPAGRVHTIARIELDSTGVEPRNRLPRDFEILFSANDPNSWSSLHSGTFFAQDTRREWQVAPVRARYIKLRIYSNWGDADAVGLGAVRAFSD